MENEGRGNDPKFSVMEFVCFTDSLIDLIKGLDSDSE